MSSFVINDLNLPDFEIEKLPCERPPERKRWRAYFNRRDDFPILWCVDNGTIATQFRVRNVVFIGVHGWFASDLGIKRADRRKGRPNEPVGWFEFDARAVFTDGVVSFYGG
jgi:hypothetical protein